MKPQCEWCGTGIITARTDARFCSSKCRIYSHRAAKKHTLPVEMTSRDRWIRRSANKIPLTINGRPASSTDPATWASHAEATNSTVGVGLGYMLGDGIGCIDLDHCLTGNTPNQAAAALLERYPNNYIEVSPSGDGLHIFGLRPEQPGTKRTIDGLSVETYSFGRYITITGNIYQHGTLAPL